MCIGFGDGGADEGRGAPLRDLLGLAELEPPHVVEDEQRLEPVGERKRLGEAAIALLAKILAERCDGALQHLHAVTTGEGGLVAQGTGAAAGPLVERQLERSAKRRLELGDARIAELSREFGFYPWGPAGSGEARFVCSWDTPEEDVDALCAALK